MKDQEKKSMEMAQSFLNRASNKLEEAKDNLDEFITITLFDSTNNCCNFILWIHFS